MGETWSFQKCIDSIRICLSSIQKKEMSEEERLREVSFIRYELEQIEQAHLVKGEEEKLQERYRYLSKCKMR